MDWLGGTKELMSLCKCISCIDIILSVVKREELK